MISRLFMLLVLVAPCAFAQAGLYGPVTVRPKAGSVAPDLAYEKLLSGASSWSRANFLGQITVLAFFPDTTDNLEAVSQWNAAVDRFAGKPVQFVWITGQKEDVLAPWLGQHPIKGWVLEDAAGKTGNAYGMEIPEDVIVGVDGKIAGFFSGLMQAGSTVRAVRDGRATTVRPTKATLKAFVAGKKVLLDGEARKMPGAEEHRPGFAPSYVVHVSESEGDEHSNSRSDDFWSLQGYTLMEAVEELYGFNAARLRLPAFLDTEQHYNFELVLPGPEGREKMRERMRLGVLEHFHLAAARESRSMEAYVLTAGAEEQPPASKMRGGGSVFELESIEAPGETDEWKAVSLQAVRGVSWEGTIQEFCHQLEAQLDRPVIDETGWKGQFMISVKAGDENRNDFLERLRSEAGLVLTPAERTVETLVVAESAP